MILLSFTIWYAIENFLALIITFILEVLDLYFGKHSKFKNRRTDFFFALSVIITFLIIVSWILVLVLLFKRLRKITKKSILKPMIHDLIDDHSSLMIFYSSFFLIRIIVPLLMFVSKQDSDILTVPCWGTMFCLCLLIQLFDYKPYRSNLNNFVHTYSQFLLILVLLTGTIISSKGIFKLRFRDKEAQAIWVIILITILSLMIGFITTAVNLIMFGRKIYKYFQNLKSKRH